MVRRRGGRIRFAACFFSRVLLPLFIYSLRTDALSANVGAGAATRPVSSWVVPRNVKFGKLSNLAFLPDDDDDDPASFREDERQEEGRREEGEESSIRVGTAAIGLNFADVFTVLGLYKAANLVRSGGGEGDKGLAPFVPGIEFAGVVLEDDGGEGGGRFRKGDRVFGFTRFGAYSDVVRAKPDFLRKIPSRWSFAQGAAFLVNALTAWHGLVNVGGMPDLRHDVGRDERDRRSGGGKKPFVVVVHSASGGVGLWASEIAARRGAVVVGVVGSEEKREVFLDRVGGLCDGAQCIVRAGDAAEFDGNLAEACRRARNASTNGSAAPPLPSFRTCLQAAEVGCGADVVMECYGGKYFRPSLEVINPGGSLSTYGATTYNDSGSGEAIFFLSLVWNYVSRPRIDPGELTGRNVRVGGFNLIFLTENTEMLVESLESCVKCLSGMDGTSSNTDFDEMLEYVNPPLVGSVFPFEDIDDGGAVRALKALRSGKTVGKVVLDNKGNPALC